MRVGPQWKHKIRWTALLVLGVLSIVGNSASASNFVNDPKYQITPGVGVGAVKIGMDEQEATAALLGYDTSVSKKPYNNDAGWELCAESGKHICAFSDDGEQVNAVVAGGDSQYWIAVKGLDDGLHVMSANLQSFLAVYRQPGCMIEGPVYGGPGIYAGWDQPGIFAAFAMVDDDATHSMLLVVEVKDGAVCSQ